MPPKYVAYRAGQLGLLHTPRGLVRARACRAPGRAAPIVASSDRVPARRATANARALVVTLTLRASCRRWAEFFVLAARRPG